MYSAYPSRDLPANRIASIVVYSPFSVNYTDKKDWRFNSNKTVLLRKRKRHTARRVASTRYAAPVGGNPSPILGSDLNRGVIPCQGVPPCQVGVHLPRQGVPLPRGVPTPYLWRGYPSPTWTLVPLPGPGKGVPPGPEKGVPHQWMGYPPHRRGVNWHTNWK